MISKKFILHQMRILWIDRYVLEKANLEITTMEKVKTDIYINIAFTTEGRFFRSCDEMLAWVAIVPMTTKFRSQVPTDWFIGLSDHLSHAANYRYYLKLSTLCSVLIFHISYCPRRPPHWPQLKFRTNNRMCTVKWFNAYRIFHWRPFNHC